MLKLTLVKCLKSINLEKHFDRRKSRRIVVNVSSFIARVDQFMTTHRPPFPPRETKIMGILINDFLSNSNHEPNICHFVIDCSMVEELNNKNIT